MYKTILCFCFCIVITKQVETVHIMQLHKRVPVLRLVI